MAETDKPGFNLSAVLFVGTVGVRVRPRIVDEHEISALALEGKRECVRVVIGRDSIFRTALDGSHTEIPADSQPAIRGLRVIDQLQVGLHALPAGRNGDGITVGESACI